MSPASAFDLKALKSVVSSAASKEGQRRPMLELCSVGLLKAESRRLTVIDPGFMHPVRLSRLLKDAPDTKARVKIATITDGENKGMPAFLVLLYGELEDAARVELAERTKLTPGERQGYVGIDSGELCVIDEAQIPRGDEMAMFEFGETLIKQRGTTVLAVIDPQNAAFLVAKSGNGDGVYPCYWLSDGKGNVVALLIDFENWNEPAGKGQAADVDVPPSPERP